jgi:eukaryotic-like serine/threonine-protein kinase
VFAVGTVLADKYRIDRVIGRGGMGIVLAATHVHLQQPVALKVLLPDLVDNKGVVERFVREARASAQLRGEHVCRVSDVGSLGNGAPYFVMELLEGRDLASLIEAAGPLQVGLAVEYVLQACLGVAEAHALGIVHRDLKPANLFLTARPDGTPLVKVLDFGIAKAQRDTNFSLTSTATVLGSPGYMSPEQLRSTRDVDVRSDVWSLGVIIYELVSGRPPFLAQSITELALRIAMDPAPPLRGSPAGFDAVVMRCLAKEPEDRYPDVASLARALAPYGGPHALEHAHTVARLLGAAGGRRPQPPLPPSVVPPTLASTGFVPEAPVAAGPPTTMGSAASSMITTRPVARRWGIVATVASLLVAIAIATVVLADGGANRPAAATTPAIEIDTVEIDAGEAIASAPDAAAAPVPSDAEVIVDQVDDVATAGAAREVAPDPDLVVEEPPRPAVRPGKRPPPVRPRAPDREDFIDSRF